MRSRIGALVLFLILFTSAGVRPAVAQFCPPPVGGGSMTETIACDPSPAPAEAQVAGWWLLQLIRSTSVNSWGTVSLTQPGIRSSAFALRERRGLTRLVPR